MIKRKSEKQPDHLYKRTKIKMTLDFSSEAIQARRQQQNTVKVLKTNKQKTC